MLIVELIDYMYEAETTELNIPTILLPTPLPFPATLVGNVQIEFLS